MGDSFGNVQRHRRSISQLIDSMYNGTTFFLYFTYKRERELAKMN